MASENAKSVAREVIKVVGSGKKVVLKDILKKHGYADSTADRPALITDSASFQNEIKPFIEKLRIERDRVQDAMSSKDLSKEDYKVLVDALDKLNKNHLLLSGQDTERLTVNTRNAETMTPEEVDEYLKQKLNASTENSS